MKNIAIIIASVLLATSAQAARWVIKNPKRTSQEVLREANHSKNLELENHYLIIDTDERLTAQELTSAFAAETSFQDLKIAVDDPSQTSQERDNKGWHANQLEYSALNKNYTGQGIIVAVLDTGVDYKHPALENKMWKNTKEIPDNKIDDDKNGLVDDFHGYNFNDDEPDPFDVSRHGTHCAGIIAAEKNKDSIAQGVAPDVKIMPLLILGDDYLGLLGDAAMAVKYATDNGAKVLSNSWRVYADWSQFQNAEGLQLLREAIQYANAHDVIFVGAAGNEKKDLDVTNLTNPIFPLSLDLPNMVAVASSARVGGAEVVSSFSNVGVKSVQVIAPGTDIYSTVPYGQWSMMSGTSMATPIVAGTLARGLSKGYNMREAMEQLNQTSVKNNFWQQYVKHGRIDIKKYLE